MGSLMKLEKEMLAEMNARIDELTGKPLNTKECEELFNLVLDRAELKAQMA